MCRMRSGSGAYSSEGGAGRAIEVRALVRGHGGANGLVDERDIALVFLDRHLGPKVWRRNQISAGLIQQQGQFLEPRNDVPDAQWQRRVFEREGGEQRVAYHFDVDG